VYARDIFNAINPLTYIRKSPCGSLTWVSTVAKLLKLEGSNLA